LPRRAVPGSSQLGAARLSRQPHPLQPARPGRALRRVGTAPAVLRGDARELPVASQIGARTSRRASVVGRLRTSTSPRSGGQGPRLPLRSAQRSARGTMGGFMGTTTSVAEAARRELAGAFDGELTSPQDGRYDEARKLFNAMIDRKPAVIARCTSPSDVARVI